VVPLVLLVEAEFRGRGGEGRRKTVRSQKSQLAALVSSSEPALSGY
jgi:hypothetical protein